MKTPTWCRRTAELVGPACKAVIAEFMADNAIHHCAQPKECSGCATNTARPPGGGVCPRHRRRRPAYRTIKGILIAGTELVEDQPTSGAAAAAGAFCAAPTQFGTDHRPVA